MESNDSCHILYDRQPGGWTIHHRNMDVEPKIGGFYPPKWMAYFMKNPIKMDDLGVPLFLETPISISQLSGKKSRSPKKNTHHPAAGLCRTSPLPFCRSVGGAVSTNGCATAFGQPNLRRMDRWGIEMMLPSTLCYFITWIHHK